MPRARGGIINTGVCPASIGNFCFVLNLINYSFLLSLPISLHFYLFTLDNFMEKAMEIEPNFVDTKCINVKMEQGTIIREEVIVKEIIFNCQF